MARATHGAPLLASGLNPCLVVSETPSPLENRKKSPFIGRLRAWQVKEIVRHDRWDKRFLNCIIFINAAKP